eukprot:2940555-Pyramimonas_sp.AAC.1
MPGLEDQDFLVDSETSKLNTGICTLHRGADCHDTHARFTSASEGCKALKERMTPKIAPKKPSIYCRPQLSLTMCMICRSKTSIEAPKLSSRPRVSSNLPSGF